MLHEGASDKAMAEAEIAFQDRVLAAIDRQDRKSERTDEEARGRLRMAIGSGQVEQHRVSSEQRKAARKAAEGVHAHRQRPKERENTRSARL